MRVLIVGLALALTACAALRTAQAPQPCLIDDECARGSTCARVETDEGIRRVCKGPVVARSRAPAPSAFPGSETTKMRAVPAMPAPPTRVSDGTCSMDGDCTFPARCIEVSGSMRGVCGEAPGQMTKVNPTIGGCSMDSQCPGTSRCEKLANGDYGCVR